MKTKQPSFRSALQRFTALLGAVSHWVEAVRIAIESILVNRLRSGLTVIGIVVGVAVVILIAALLEGAQNFVAKVTADFAPDVIRVEKAAFQDFSGDGQAFIEANSKRPDILPDDLRFLRERLGANVDIGAQTDAFLPVRRAGKTLRGIVVQGVTPNITVLTNVRVARGREFSEVDDAYRRPVCIIGTDVADELFPNSDPLESELRVGQLPFKVVGIADSRGSLFGQSQDAFILIPLGAFTRIFGERTRSIALLARALPAAGLRAEDVEELTRANMRLRRRLRNGVDEDNFSIVTAKSVQAFTSSITRVVGATLYPLTAIALVVGGVVVMNMMLASVTERTREIGVRLAIGARRRDILMQFLVEATSLTLIGGMFGVCLATTLVWLIAAVTSLPIYLPLWSAGVALIVSCVVGLIFGVVPARRAARLDPIEALRAE